MRRGLLIAAHGSRDASANLELGALVEEYAAARPEIAVAHGYVELAEPPLDQALHALAERCEQVVVLPLFLFAAGHVKNDLPLALARARRAWPGHVFTSAPALGVHASLVELARLRAQSVSSGKAAGTRTALVVVGRGASDPDANADFCKAVRLIGEGQDYACVLPCFAGITKPLLPDALELAARTRPERVVVLPYFLFAGRLIGKLHESVAVFRARYPWIRCEQAPHLGRDQRLLELIDERMRQAVSGSQTLACDNCQYRVPLAGKPEQVGGLRALLWSLRHGYTHTQAMPHEHAHRPLHKHVLVCGNVDCAERGSPALISALRRLLREAGREADVRVTRTHCMGRCGEGPTIAVYPDGIWYRGVRAEDAAELVNEHLLADRLVGRLVDDIMQ